MKIRYSLFAVLAIIVASCSKEELPSITITDNSTSVTLNYDPSVKQSFTFTSNKSWKLSDYDSSVLTISPTSGVAGATQMLINAVNPNSNNGSLEYSFTITAYGKEDETSQTVTVIQPSVFTMADTNYQVDTDGGYITFYFNTDVDLDDVGLMGDNTFSQMLDESTSTKTRINVGDQTLMSCDVKRISANAGSFPSTETETYTYEGKLYFKANKTGSSRTGAFCLCDYNNSDLRSVVMSVTQPSSNSSAYQSTDYSQDGVAATLQKHSKGTAGYKIIFMGDAFTDKDIADSTYLNTMKEGEEQLFAQEPMASLREYCDVYYVNAVSKEGSVDNQRTAFKSTFDSSGSSKIEGDEDKAIEYAEKVVSDDDLDNALIIILINSTNYGGTTYLYEGTNKSKNDVPQGLSIAFVPLVGSTYATSGITQQEILQHEAVGHGIGKLADEYSYAENGSILSNKNKAELDTLLMVQKTYRMMLNISDQSTVSSTYWADFAADNTYSGESLGCYEGAYGFVKGLYRPVDDGLMNDGSYLPAPERQLIYKRVMNIANNYSFSYSYDDFKTFDEAGRKEYVNHAANARRRVSEKTSALALPPLSEPVIRTRTRRGH